MRITIPEINSILLCSFNPRTACESKKNYICTKVILSTCLGDMSYTITIIETENSYLCVFFLPFYLHTGIVSKIKNAWNIDY